MSGAAGLSAAKRRRGPQSQSRPQSAPTQHEAPPPPQASNSGGLTPMQLLQQHHQRIGQIEQNQHMMSDTISNISGASMTGSDGLAVEAVNEVRGRVDAIEKEMRVRNDEPPEDLSFFREKTVKLEKQVAELKQMMMKIQTFAMETNFTLLKYKNGMDAQLAAQLKAAHSASGDTLPEIADDGTFDEDCLDGDQEQNNGEN